MKNRSSSEINTVYLRESSSVVTIANSASAAASSEKFADEIDAGDYQPWGSDNLYPKNSRLKVEGSSTALPLMVKKVEMMFGRGLFYYKEKKTTSGLEYEFPEVAEINEFIINNDVNYLMLERMMDFVMLNNCFTEFIKNKSNNKIVNINHLEAEFTRFGKIGDDKKVTSILYTGNWEKDITPSDSIPLLSRREKTKEGIKKYTKKFVFHSCFPSPGRTLYAISTNAALYKKGGWLDYGNSVPEIMNSINDNAMNIKYHIQIPESYFPSINKDWQSLDPKQKEQFINNKLDEMDKWLAGKANSHKSFISFFATDPVTGKKISGWEITVIDDKSKKDAYLTSLQESDTQISRSIGHDTSMSGIQPQGGKMGAGSGSDKRVGFQNSIAMSYAAAHIITEPLRIVQLYNGWDPEIKFGFWHDVPTALNENPTGTEATL